MIKPNINHGKSKYADDERHGIPPEKQRRKNRHGAKYPQIGRGRGILLDLSSGPYTCCPANQTPEYQCVQMESIRHPRRDPLDKLSPIDGEECFKYRINNQQQRKPRGNLLVPRYQQNRNLTDLKTDQIGATIAEKDLATRVIPDKEPQDAAYGREA